MAGPMESEARSALIFFSTLLIRQRGLQALWTSLHHEGKKTYLPFDNLFKKYTLIFTALTLFVCLLIYYLFCFPCQSHHPPIHVPSFLPSLVKPFLFLLPLNSPFVLFFYLSRCPTPSKVSLISDSWIV